MRRVLLFRIVKYFLIIEFLNNCNVSVSYLIFTIAQLKSFCLFSFPNGGEENPSRGHFYYIRLMELMKWCLPFFLLELQTQEMKKVIKSYNQMAAVLLEFELIYHRAWCRFADRARNALCASLLFRHPETKVYMIYSLCYCCLA